MPVAVAVAVDVAVSVAKPDNFFPFNSTTGLVIFLEDAITERGVNWRERERTEVDLDGGNCVAVAPWSKPRYCDPH